MHPSGRTRARLLLAAAIASLALWLSACEALFEPLQPTPQAHEEAAASPQMVRVAVASAALPLAENLRLAYMGYRPGVAIEIMPMSSEQAYGLATAGQADLAIVSAPDEQSLRHWAPALSWQPLAHDGVAIITHRDHPLPQLSRRELESLYAGHVADWSLLEAGTGVPELAIQGADATARQLFDSVIMAEREVTSAALVLPHDEAVLAYVAEHPLAIGYLSAAYLESDERVKVIALDRLLPTRSQLEQGGYPLGYVLFIAQAPGAPDEAARLASFALGRAGQEVIGQRYGLPR
jgi:phosphate transport system substrate-binding protein